MPYDSSALTKLLKNVLGGNSKTIMVNIIHFKAWFNLKELRDHFWRKLQQSVGSSQDIVGVLQEIDVRSQRDHNWSLGDLFITYTSANNWFFLKIAAISPSDNNYDETLSTLQCGLFTLN